MKLSKLADILKCTKTITLQTLKMLRTEGMVEIAIEEWKPAKAFITQKGLDTLASISQIQNRESRRRSQHQSLGYQVLSVLNILT